MSLSYFLWQPFRGDWGEPLQHVAYHHFVILLGDAMSNEHGSGPVKIIIVLGSVKHVIFNLLSNAFPGTGFLETLPADDYTYDDLSVRRATSL